MPWTSRQVGHRLREPVDFLGLGVADIPLCTGDFVEQHEQLFELAVGLGAKVQGDGIEVLSLADFLSAHLPHLINSINDDGAVRQFTRF